MREIGQILLGVFALSVVALIIVFTLRAVLVGFSGVNPTIAVAVIGGIVSICGLIASNTFNAMRAREEFHRAKKIELYNELIDIVFDLLDQHRAGELTQQEIQERFDLPFRSFVRKCVFYGSPKVILSLSEFMLAEHVTEKEPIQKMGRVFLAMRSDVGLSNRGADRVKYTATLCKG